MSRADDLVEFIATYDARVGPAAALSAWTEARRQQFLIVPDAAQPRSIDPLVWPSVFDRETDRVARLFGTTAIDLEPADTQGEILCMDGWPCLPTLLEALASSSIHDEPTVIAITRVVRAGQAVRRSYPSLSAVMTDTFAPSDQWTCLGYDVATATLLSGLLNCGLSEGDTRAPASALNTHHLFTTPEHAVHWATRISADIAEEGPFHAFGLHVWSGTAGRRFA